MWKPSFVFRHINPFFLTDGYKTGHHKQYPDKTVLVYSNFTGRSFRYAPKKCIKLVSFGQQMAFMQIHAAFKHGFFDMPKDEVCQEVKREYSLYLNQDYDVTHIEKLHDLGYLPIEVKTLKEGTLVGVKVPILTIKNTNPEFYWVTNFLETIISNLLWKATTSATIARSYRQLLTHWQQKTDPDTSWFIDWQAHDFSMRGLDGIDPCIASGLGHATGFMGSDSLPVIPGARKYYGAQGQVIGSVNATEHSVMCAGNKDDELETFRRLLRIYATGILSVVSDTWDLWKVCTVYLPALKEEILKRPDKLVIRPDSGDPVDITCGFKYSEDILEAGEQRILYYKKATNEYYTVKMYGEDEYNHGSWGVDKLVPTTPAMKGVVELLWEVFGGKTNAQGYKVLDPHIGMIYGDSITLDRAEQICERLAQKGFASTNVVFGVGSFTYQLNTRDTFGFAMKATYVEVLEECQDDLQCQGGPSIGDWIAVGREIFKNPVTDDGTKKSATGLLKVVLKDGEYELLDRVSIREEEEGELKVLYKDGEFYNLTTFEEIRERLKNVA